MGTLIAVGIAFVAGILARHFWPQEKALIAKEGKAIGDKIKKKL